MWRRATERIYAGLLSGAVGTQALNIATYLDMALRGRPESPVPVKGARMVGEMAGIQALVEDGEAAESRRKGVGALMGFATGISVGGAYGVFSPMLARMPRGSKALLVSAAAMAAGDVPSVLSGLTDPKEWSAQDWLADIVPHMAYGLATVLAFDACRPKG
jgi:hypothetical protein